MKKIDFNRPIQNMDGEPINFAIKDEDGEEQDTRHLKLDNQILDIINNAEFNSIKERYNANRICGLISDESIDEYEDSQIERIRDIVDDQMPIENKPPQIMMDIAETLYEGDEDG